MANLYRTQTTSETEGPHYVIEDGRLYRTIHHPAGWSPTPDYEIRNDGKVYAVTGNDGQAPALPVYEFREMLLYRTAAHPAGVGSQADYYLFD